MNTVINTVTFCAIVVLIVLCSWVAQAQGQHLPSKLPAEANKAAATTVTQLEFPLGAEDRMKIRDAQVQWDQLEIENQKALVRIEQNKAHQVDLMNIVKSTAFNFAQANKVDLGMFELDPNGVKFVKKTGK